MEKSELEKLNDKTLKKLILQIVTICDNEDVDWRDAFNDGSVYEIFTSSISVLGLGDDVIDVDYILNVMSLNMIKNSDGSENLSETLNRPKIGKYGIEVEVEESVYQTVTYRHITHSYSINTVAEQMKYLENEGIVSVFEGKVTSTEVHDSSINEINFLEPFKLK